MILLYLILRDMLKLSLYVLEGLVKLFMWVCLVLYRGIELAVTAYVERKDANDGTHEEGTYQEGAAQQARYSDRR